jgi:hypothetical protein
MKKIPSHCNKAFRQICENLGENVGSPQCRAIRTHLGKCDDCAAYLDSLLKTAELYRRYPTPPLRKRGRTLDLIRVVSAPRARKRGTAK